MEQDIWESSSFFCWENTYLITFLLTWTLFQSIRSYDFLQIGCNGAWESFVFGFIECHGRRLWMYSQGKILSSTIGHWTYSSKILVNGWAISENWITVLVFLCIAYPFQERYMKISSSSKKIYKNQLTES